MSEDLDVARVMTAPNRHAGPGAPPPRRRLDHNFGLFVHLVPGLSATSKGETATAAMIEDFDVERFADDARSFGVEYVRFTAWHKGMIPLYPSRVARRWRGNLAFFSRDLIGELIEALSARGIAVQLYTHPRDGHDFSRSDQRATGWGDRAPEGLPDPDAVAFDRETWNRFIAESYEELLERYGSRISSLYLDEGSERADSEWVVDYAGLLALVRQRAPHIVVQQNYYGNLYGADVPDHEYYRWGEFSSLDGSVWPAHANMSVSAVVGSIWWAAESRKSYDPAYSAADIFRYLVLQISACLPGGGLALAAGPFSDGGWEPGVAELLQSVAGLIAPIAESVLDVTASRRWPTPGGANTADVGWGVATERGRTTYLHILNPPAHAWVDILPARDRAVPLRAARVDTGEAVEVQELPGGWLRILPTTSAWDAVDTVIRLDFAEDCAVQ